MLLLWVTLIIPVIMDPCSPVWSSHPTNYNQILRNELTDRYLTPQKSSIQPRNSCHKVLYIYKIKEGVFPNLPTCQEPIHFNSTTISELVLMFHAPYTEYFPSFSILVIIDDDGVRKCKVNKVGITMNSTGL